MQKDHKVLFDIVKSAFVDGVNVNIEDVDHTVFFELSKKHQIVPLVFQGLHKVAGKFEGEEKYHQAIFKLMIRDQNQLYWIEQIENVFNNNKIDYMLLKGASIKKIYPSTEMRVMGDVDILIKEEQYSAIRELLLKIGLIECKETDHELIWKAPSDVLIELHKKLIPSYNDDYYSYYCNAWDMAVKAKGNRYTMSVEDEYVYLFTHLTKHYRDGGIGLRHIIDLWYFKIVHPEINMDQVYQELEKLELFEFHKNIQHTVDVWFEGKESTALTDYITERIVESGSYGIKEKWDIASATRLSAESLSASSAKRKKLLSLIFMPYSSMKRKYPILERLPFLLPVMWVVRWIDAIVNRRDGISRHTERLEQIDAQKIDSYTKELEMVGLKFDLKK